MILDHISRFRKLFPSAEAKPIADFIQSLSPDTPDGEYPLIEEAAFARIMTYQSKRREGALYEAHRQYADIQLLLGGEEVIDWAALESVALKTEFDAEKDVAFYSQGSESPTSIAIIPGLFAIFFPWDAHMPQLMAGSSPATVRKVVVKVRPALLSLV